jgi:hypothetical protein
MAFSSLCARPYDSHNDYVALPVMCEKLECQIVDATHLSAK